MLKREKLIYGVKPSYLTEEMILRSKLLENIIARADYAIKELPDGMIHAAPGKTENSFRYYIRNGSDEKYLDKSCDNLKEQLSRKRYYEKLSKYAKAELKALRKAATVIKGDSLKLSYSSLSKGVKQLISPIIEDDDSYIEEWEKIEYESLKFDENDTTEFYSDKGERMRSKSEVMIANSLINNNIPYHYEMPLYLDGGKKYYPDFTILRVKKRDVIYWEHLGKIGDQEYMTRNIKKFDDYKMNGLYIGKNILVSYENFRQPISSREIKELIDFIKAG